MRPMSRADTSRVWDAPSRSRRARRWRCRSQTQLTRFLPECAQLNRAVVLCPWRELFYITAAAGGRNLTVFHKSQKVTFFRGVSRAAETDNIRAQIGSDVPDFLSSGWSPGLAF